MSNEFVTNTALPSLMTLPRIYPFSVLDSSNKAANFLCLDVLHSRRANEHQLEQHYSRVI